MRRLEMRYIVRATSVLGILCAIGMLAPVAAGYAIGANDAAELRQSAEESIEATVEARRDTIDHEIGHTPAHPWAADYYEGDGLGANIFLSIAPKSGVAATWHGCLGLYGANLGAVIPEPDGSLQLQFEQPNEARFGGFPDRVVPVRWGARRYLIRPSDTAGFVAAIHAGSEPRTQVHGQFLLAEGDELKPVSGLPGLPEPDRVRIRLQAVEARIVEVGEPERGDKTVDMCDARYPVRLVVDGDEVLHPGEELQLLGRSSPFTDIIVREASPGSARGLAKVLELDCGKPDADHVPAEGWRLTTGAYDEISANRAIAEASRASATQASR